MGFDFTEVDLSLFDPHLGTTTTIRRGSTRALTPAQLGIYYDCVASDNQGSYVEQPNWYIDGELNLRELERAWELTSEARDNLRLSLELDQNSQELRQAVTNEVKPDIRRLDWSDSDAGTIEDRLLELLAADRRESFDLGKSPLWRLHVVRLAPNRHWLCWTIHHLISDGWSGTLVLADVFRTYGALTTGSTVSAARAQFRSYLDLLSRHGPEQTAAYWARRFSGFSAGNESISIPSAQRTPIRVDREIGSRAFAALQDFCRQHRLTVASLSTSVWSALRGAESGVLDVLVGTASAGRPPSLAGVEQISGLFMTVLPTRSTIQTSRPLVEWLADQQRMQASDRDHSQTAHLAVDGLSRPLRPASLLSFQNYPDAASFARVIEDATSGKLKVRDAILYYSYTRYPLDVTILPSDGALRLSIHASRESLTPAQAEHTADEFVHALLNVGMTRTVSDLFVGSTAIVPRRSSSFPRAAALSENIVTLFKEQLARTPDAEALRDPNGALTFKELDDSSTIVAAALRTAGVTNESAVGLDLPRGNALVLAMLAVWRAGGAFFAIDATQPRQRLRSQLSRARVEVMLTLDPDNWANEDVIALTLDSTSSKSEHVDANLTSANLAYITATSGTTGEPRLVLNQHGGLADHVRGQLTDIYPDSSIRRVAVVGSAPTSFDAFLDNILPAIGLGHLAVLNDGDKPWDPSALTDLIGAKENYVLDITPSQLGVFLSVNPALLDDVSLSGLVFGGERPSVELWSKLRASRQRASAFSIYGATECAIGSTVSVPAESEEITIGEPSEGTRILLLNDDLQAQSDGATGQIVIAGDGVGRGYAGAPRDTALAFLPDPWSPVPGARMYATGDLGQRTPSGIEFRGRQDSQVKIRGIRVDLTEIEHAFERQHGVKRAFALLTGSDRQTLGCLVQTETAQGLESVSAGVAQELPANMLPTQLAFCREMPLTRAGKIDAEVARLFLQNTNFGALPVEPLSPPQQKMCEIWADVLAVDSVGLDDDFFSLGGHSLSAIALSARVARTLRESQNVVREILRLRTPRLLCEELDGHWDYQSGFDRLIAVDRSQPIEMPAAQRRLWLLDLTGSPTERAAYNICVRLNFEGDLNRAALQAALNEVVARNEAFRLIYDMVDSRAVVRVLAPNDVSGRVIVFNSAPSASLVFDLTQPPFLAAFIEDGESGSTTFTLYLHHICVDGASLSLLHSDLIQAYASATSVTSFGVRPELDLLDYTEWQRTQFSQHDHQNSANYWARELVGAEPTFVPADHALSSKGVGTLHRSLESDVAGALKTTSAQLGYTPFDLCMSVLAEVLRTRAGTDDIMIAIPVSGRWHPQSEQMIGFLTNTLPLRLDVSGQPSLADMSAHVAGKLTSAVSHARVNYDEIISELPEGNELRLNGLGVLFQYSHRESSSTLDWGRGLRATILPTADPVARFAFSMNLTDLGNEILLECNYDPDIYLKRTIQSLIEQFSRLLLASCTDPHIAMRYLHPHNRGTL